MAQPQLKRIEKSLIASEKSTKFVKNQPGAQARETVRLVANLEGPSKDATLQRHAEANLSNPEAAVFVAFSKLEPELETAHSFQVVEDKPSKIGEKVANELEADEIKMIDELEGVVE